MGAQPRMGAGSCGAPRWQWKGRWELQQEGVTVNTSTTTAARGLMQGRGREATGTGEKERTSVAWRSGGNRSSWPRLRRRQHRLDVPRGGFGAEAEGREAVRPSALVDVEGQVRVHSVRGVNDLGAEMCEQRHGTGHGTITGRAMTGALGYKRNMGQHAHTRLIAGVRGALGHPACCTPQCTRATTTCISRTCARVAPDIAPPRAGRSWGLGHPPAG
jgi:hypothetical protein